MRGRCLLVFTALLAVGCTGNLSSVDGAGGAGGAGDTSGSGATTGSGGGGGTGGSGGTAGTGGAAGTGGTAGTGGVAGSGGVGGTAGTGGIAGSGGSAGSAGSGGVGGNCGNDLRDPGELCDGSDLAGLDCESVVTGSPGGTLSCTANCLGLDASGCLPPPECGNDIIEVGEECDGSALGGAACTDFGFYGGALACDSGCAVDVSGCIEDPHPPCAAGEEGFTRCYGDVLQTCTAGSYVDTTDCTTLTPQEECAEIDSTTAGCRVPLPGPLASCNLNDAQPCATGLRCVRVYGDDATTTDIEGALCLPDCTNDPSVCSVLDDPATGAVGYCDDSGWIFWNDFSTSQAESVCWIQSGFLGQCMPFGATGACDPTVPGTACVVTSTQWGEPPAVPPNGIIVSSTFNSYWYSTNLNYECRQECPVSEIGTTSTCTPIPNPAGGTMPTTCLPDILPGDDSGVSCDPGHNGDCQSPGGLGPEYTCVTVDPGDFIGTCAYAGGRCGIPSTSMSAFDDTFDWHTSDDHSCGVFGEPRYCAPPGADSSGNPATARAVCEQVAGTYIPQEQVTDGVCVGSAGLQPGLSPCTNDSDCDLSAGETCFQPVSCLGGPDCMSRGLGRCRNMSMSSYHSTWPDTACVGSRGVCVTPCDDVDPGTGNVLGQLTCPAGTSCSLPTWTDIGTFGWGGLLLGSEFPCTDSSQCNTANGFSCEQLSWATVKICVRQRRFCY